MEKCKRCGSKKVEKHGTGPGETPWWLCRVSGWNWNEGEPEEKEPPKTIRYTSSNGYSGILYGFSSMSIYNPEGLEILHTGFRKANTLEELKVLVDREAAKITELSKVLDEVEE